MIVSKIIEIDKTNDNLEIERALRARGIEPVRWAVIETLRDKFRLSVSYLET